LYNTINGTPVEECTKLIWHILNRLRVYKQPLFDSEDLVQIGLEFLIKYSKTVEGKKDWMRHPYVYKSLRWYISQYLSKHMTWFKTTQHSFNKYNSLLKTCDPVYLNASTNEKVNIYELFADGKINIKDRVILQDFYTARKYPISLHDCMTRGNTVDTGISTREDNEKTDSLFSLSDGGLFEEFRNYLDNAPELSDRDRKLFKYYHGLGVKRKSGTQLAVRFKLDRNSVYRILTKIKKILLKPEGWIEREYGKKITDKLRSEYEICKN